MIARARQAALDEDPNLEHGMAEDRKAVAVGEQLKSGGNCHLEGFSAPVH